MIFVVVREYEEINRAHASAIHNGFDATSSSVLATIHQQGLPSGCNKEGGARLFDIDVVDA
jgi:hypothetical protein